MPIGPETRLKVATVVTGRGRTGSCPIDTAAPFARTKTIGTSTPTDLFREWLVRRIAERGLSHAQLAIRAGIDRSTVGRILNGDRRPTLDTAIRLVAALDADAPRAVASLVGLGDPVDRVAQAFRDDPYLSQAHASDLLRRYRQLRDPERPVCE